MLRMKLQLLLDPVLHQKAHVGVRHRKAVTHINLFLGLLCCNTKTTLVNIHTVHIIPAGHLRMYPKILCRSPKNQSLLCTAVKSMSKIYLHTCFSFGKM